MPTKAEMEAQAAAAARRATEATKLRQLHRDTRVPDATKVAKLTKTYERDGRVNTFTLDYLGHADTTDLLLQHDPHWNWEPAFFTYDDQGRVTGFVIDRDSKGWARGLWIKLTIHDVTRLGYGSCAPGKPDAVKELIGDAIRNAAMRFGVALSLWSKADQDGWGDLPPVDDDGPPEPPQAPDPAPEPAPASTGPANGNAPAAVNAPLTPEAAPEQAPATAPEPDPMAAAPTRDDLQLEVGKLLGAMRGTQAQAFAQQKTAAGWPGDLTTASDDVLADVLAWLKSQPVARVAS